MSKSGKAINSRVGQCINNMPHVVHCNRESYDIFIGRGSKWGNPFLIGIDGNRDEVIRKYEEWIREQPELMEAIPELEGKVLGCWCSPKPCHGDVLVSLCVENILFK